MRLKAGLLTAFLVWDYVAAPAGESALARGSHAFAQTEFAQKLTRYAESGQFQAQLRTSVAATLAWLDAQSMASSTAFATTAASASPGPALPRPALATGEPFPPAPPAPEAAVPAPTQAAPERPTNEPAAKEPATPAKPQVAAPEAAAPPKVASDVLRMPLDVAGVSPPASVVNHAVMEAARFDAAMPSEAAAQAVVLGTDLLSAIMAASNKTGADAGYLLHIAVRESGLWADAKAPTSSAKGPFQFIEQTWFRMIALHGAKDGYAKEAAEMKKNANGTYAPVSAEARKEILALRSDARASSFMAAELTVDNAAALKTSLGREPTHGELYAAHILGVGGAIRLIQTRDKSANVSAASVLPAAAAANRWLFYDGNAPRSVTDLFDDISRFQSTREVARVCTAGLNFAASK